MANKTYTVLVMSDGGTSVRKFKVTSRRIRLVIWGVSALILLLAGAVIVAYMFGSRWTQDESRVTGLARANSDLREKIKEANAQVRQVQSKVSSMVSSLEQVTRYARRLRRFTHLSDPERKLAMGPLAGGTTERPVVVTDEEEDSMKTARERRGMRVGLVTRKLQNLQGRAEETQAELERLQKYFKDRQVVLSSTPSIWPTRGSFASGFGMRKDPIVGVYRFHKGIDVFAETGTPVIAPASGTVTFSANRGGYGLHVVVDHGFGVKTLYAHLSKSEVKVGQKVKRGDRMGLVGSTGRTTGPHLHYEVRFNEVPQNPLRYILD